MGYNPNSDPTARRKAEAQRRWEILQSMMSSAPNDARGGVMAQAPVPAGNAAQLSRMDEEANITNNTVFPTNGYSIPGVDPASVPPVATRPPVARAAAGPAPVNARTGAPRYTSPWEYIGDMLDVGSGQGTGRFRQGAPLPPRSGPSAPPPPLSAPGEAPLPPVTNGAPNPQLTAMDPAAAPAGSLPGFMTNPAATPGAPPMEGQDEGMLSGIDPYLAAIEKFFPMPPTDNAKQDKADAYAQNEMQRTALLAQLAFAGGITAAAGGPYEAVGQGFMNAAGIYDKGFSRYQNALQDSADRYVKQRSDTYANQNDRREAALKLFTADKADNRERSAARAKMIDTWFKEELDAAKNDTLGSDPKRIAEIQRRRELALQMGQYIPTEEDVSDQ